MTQIYICDDEPVWIEQMAQAITAFMVSSDWAVTILCKSTRPETLLDCLLQNQTLNGIYFLDISLKAEINGIALGARIRELDPEAVLIFVTTHDELVMDTFRLKLQAADYILKDSGDLNSQIGDTLRALELHYGNSAGRPSAPRIQLTTGSVFHFIIKDDIYFVESQKNMHKLFVHMRSEVFTAAMPLKDMAEQLGDGFIFCRRGCLINPHHVVKIDPASRHIEFDNQERCSCSHRAQKAIMERMQTLHFMAGNRRLALAKQPE